MGLIRRNAWELRLGDDRSRIDVADDEIRVARGDAPRADAMIETDPDTLGAVLWKGQSLAYAQRSGQLALGGDTAMVKRFLRLFPRPAPATVTSA